MKLHHRIIGEGRDLFLFHGLFGMSDNLQGLAKMLAANGYRVILADMRNHGHSPHEAMHTYPLMAADIAELIHDFNSHHPFIAGHSMGGKAVLQTLCDYPQLASRAVVIDIAPWKYPVHHREILDALLAVQPDRIDSRSQAEDILERAIDDTGTKQFLLKNLYRKSDGSFDWRFNLKVLDGQIEEVGEPTWPSVPVKTPLLFVKGERSGYIDPFRFNEILQWFPGAECCEIQGAGHWVHAERPKELAEAMISFLSNNEKTSMQE